MTYKSVPHAVKRSESLNTRHSRGQFLCPRKVSILQKEVCVLTARKEIRYVYQQTYFGSLSFFAELKVELNSRKKKQTAVSMTK